MAITHATAADATFSAAGTTAWNQAHTVPDNELVAAKLSATGTDKLFGRSTAGAGAGEEITCTAAGRALLDDAAASNQRTTLGLGTLATQDANNVAVTGGSITGITDLAVADGGTGASDASGARTNLGLGTISTQAASAVNLTGGTITGVTGAEYTLQFVGTAGNPGDAATYFIGLIASITAVTTSGVVRIPIPASGTVVRIDVHIGVGGTLGTTETSTMSFRLNNTTDTTISSAIVANATSQFFSAAVSIAVVAGDYFEIKWVTPTWVTNPTNVLVNGSVTVRR